MLESQMEQLIAAYPAEFFPRKTLTLTGRQGAFSGVGRFDLMFRDEHNTNILMELKARPAKYEDATQLAKYHDALKQRGTTDIVMWLVATAIPNSVREFLDRIGIEYTEIHESEYRVVALRNGEAVDTVAEPVAPSPRQLPIERPEASLNPVASTRITSVAVRSRLTPKFRASMDRIRTIFPAAFQFLVYIEQHSYDGFWLSSATNAHLYFRDSFLAFVQLGSDGILFSPNYNGQIDGGTTDRHKLIFPDVFRRLASSNDGTVAPWARFRHDGSVTINSQAPVEFFTGLITEIEKVHRSANAV